MKRWDGPIYMLRGEENALGDSQEIVRAIEVGGVWELDKAAMRAHKKETREAKRIWKQVCAPVDGEPHEAVILSTVADEGMDIPMIDRLHIVFPLRQEAATIQLIGRCERVAPDKHDAVVINYHDMRTSVFNDHHAERMNTFRYHGLEVEPSREEMKGCLESARD